MRVNSFEAKKDRSGFTLLELVVVMVLVGIFILISAPTYIKRMQVLKEQEAVERARTVAERVSEYYRTKRFGDKCVGGNCLTDVIYKDTELIDKIKSEKLIPQMYDTSGIREVEIDWWGKDKSHYVSELGLKYNPFVLVPKGFSGYSKPLPTNPPYPVGCENWHGYVKVKVCSTDAGEPLQGLLLSSDLEFDKASGCYMVYTPLIPVTFMDDYLWKGKILGCYRDGSG